MSFFYSAADYSHLPSDSAQIQAAVNEAAKAGGVAVIPSVNPRTGKDVWDIDETILLPDRTVLKLINAHLRLTDDFIGHMFQNSNAETPLGRTQAGRQYDISLLGLGHSVLDGGRYNGIVEKANKLPGAIHSRNNIMTLMYNVEGFRMEGLTITNHRYWSTAMFYCSNVTIRDMTVQSWCNVPNQDGFDVLRGCHHVLIENIRGCTGDDMVAISTMGRPDELSKEGADPDIHDVIVRNLQIYSANGCALIRILNHDGNRIYRVLIDGIQETSPSSETDRVYAPNPDLYGTLDENHRFVLEPKQILGQYGYRADAAIRIGENFWYSDHPAEPGDTWGITVRNVSTHAQSAVTVANTLYDSSFENIRLHGNGFRAILFNNGTVKNVTCRDITWTEECRPHPEDDVVDIGWNSTHTEGLSAFHFCGTEVENLLFSGIRTGFGLECVFGGNGKGTIHADHVSALDDATLLLPSGETPDPSDDYEIEL